MTALLNLAACVRVGRLAVIAAALVIGIVAFGVPAVTEAAGAGQAAAGASENTPVCSIIFMGFFGWLIDLMTGGALERTLC